MTSITHSFEQFEQVFVRQMVKVRVRVRANHIIVKSDWKWLVKWRKHVLQGAKRTLYIHYFYLKWRRTRLVRRCECCPWWRCGCGHWLRGCNGNWWFTSTLSLATEHGMATIARYPVTWCDGLIWWRHTGSLQCSGSPNTNKDTFLSRSCVYLELYFIISLRYQQFIVC